MSSLIEPELMIKLLVLGTRIFENFKNSPHGFCLGSSFGYKVCTYGVIREQFEAVHGHKKEINLYAGHKWPVEISNHQRKFNQLFRKHKLLRRVRILKNEIT